MIPRDVQFGRRSRYVLAVATLLCVLAVAWLDHLTGTSVSLAVFYTLAVGFGSWFVSTRYGLLVAVFAATVWLLADAWHGVPESGSHVLAWNALVRLAVFLLIVWLVAGLRSARQHLEQAVAERTAALRAEIAERQRSEAAARESQAKLQAIIDAAADGILSIDVCGKILTINPAGERILGCSAADLIGHDVARLVPEPERQRHVSAIARYLQTGEKHILGRWQELSGQRCDGSRFPMELAVTEVTDAPQRMFIAIFRDITARKAAEEAWRSNETRLRLLTQKVPAILWTTDRDLRFTSATGAALHLLNQQPDQLVGMALDQLFGADDPDCLHVAQHREALAGKPVSYEAPWLGREFHINLEPLKDTHDQIIGTVGAAVDVTDRKRLERDLLEISDQEKARFGQDLHDGLCQHLTATMFASKILEEKLAEKSLPEQADAREIAEFLSVGIAQARDLAHGLWPAKLDTGDLGAALAELARAVERIFCVLCRYDGPDAMALGDAVVAIHLYRIAQEAIANAVKHARPQRLVISLGNGNDTLALTVLDDGDGIAPNAKEGLGLRTMTYRARAIGGQLEIALRPEGGTRVCCTCPRTKISYQI